MIKALDIKSSVVFNYVFTNNTILTCFFPFFLIIHLYFLIPAVIAQVFNPISEFVIPIGMLTKAEIETHPVTAEVQYNLNLANLFVLLTNFC